MPPSPSFLISHNSVRFQFNTPSTNWESFWRCGTTGFYYKKRGTPSFLAFYFFAVQEVTRTYPAARKRGFRIPPSLANLNGKNQFKETNQRTYISYFSYPKEISTDESTDEYMEIDELE
jgi:hypothetical protein